MSRCEAGYLCQGVKQGIRVTQRCGSFTHNHTAEYVIFNAYLCDLIGIEMLP